MTSRLLLVLTVSGAVGAGLVGGVFFAFSTFVMGGLRRLTPKEGIRAMQAINEAALAPPFMILLFGTAALCLGLAVTGMVRWGEDGAALLVAGGLLYVVVMAMTAAFHVPRNLALALVDPESTGAAAEWATYVRSWVAGNHVRTLAGTGAAALLTLAARAL
ncbi:hypothetical protein B7486_62285 [cyanobacterium TDX16]|nr:hypothetical protein B7486_62285 [cyanobacterium TDX16]